MPGSPPQPDRIPRREPIIETRETPSLLPIHLSLLLTAAIWGGSFPAIKYLLQSLQPIDVLAIRVGGGALFFVAVLIVTRQPFLPTSLADAARLFSLGVVGMTVMSFALISGQRMIPAAMASLIVTSNPIFTAVIARFVTGEPLTRRKIAGIGLACAGFVIVLLYGSGKQAELSTANVKGMLIVAIAPFSWAFYTVLSKPLLTRYQPTQVAAYTIVSGAFAAIPLFLLKGGDVAGIARMSPLQWIIAMFLAWAGIGVGYTLWYRGLRVLSASQTAVYVYLVPVFGLFFAWWFLNEEITPYLLLGGLVILGGVVLTNSQRTVHPEEPETTAARRDLAGHEAPASS